MKRITYLKTLLVGLLVCGVTSAWAESKIIYSWTFTGNAADADLTMSSDKISENKTDCFLATNPTDCAGLYFQGKWKRYKANNGLRNVDKGDRMCIIPNLKKDDVITIFCNNSDWINTTKYTGTTNTEKTSISFTMEADGNFYFKMIKAGATVDDVQIYPSLYSIEVSREITAGFCDNPIIKVTGADNDARIITITCETPGATIYYSESELSSADGGYQYTEPITTSAETIWAYAKTDDAASEVVSFQTGAGETITLNAPSIAKTLYTDGQYKIEVYSDQANLSIVPVSVTIKYSIDGGDTQNYVGAIQVNEGSSITAYIESNGYATSGTTTCETEARYTGLTQAWTQDYTNITKESGTGAFPVVLSGSADTSDGDFQIKDTKYFNIIGYKKDQEIINVNLNTNVGLNVATNYNLRCNGSNSGILQNGANQNIGIKGLHAGDVIYITTNGNSLGALNGVTLKDKMSTTTEYIFLANSSEAEIRFYKGTYNYVKSITVYSPSTVSAKVSEAGYATYISSYALDFSTVSGLTAYTASINGNKVSFIEVTKVPANTGVLLKANAGNYNIPVVADGGDATSALVGGGKAPAGSFVLMNKDGKVGFYKTTNEFTLTANTAYIPGTASARGFIAIDGEATGISAVSAEQQGAEVYNLNGQRVSKAQKGLYIQNGKKVIMK